MERNMKMVRGDTLSFAAKITFDSDVQELDTAYFTCKANVDDTELVFQKSLSDGITKVSEEGNTLIYRVRVAPEDTEEIEVGDYYYELEIGLNSDEFTILKGILKIEWNLD